jgi:hypothetical protein
MVLKPFQNRGFVGSYFEPPAQAFIVRARRRTLGPSNRSTGGGLSRTAESRGVDLAGSWDPTDGLRLKKARQQSPLPYSDADAVRY